ncbi:adenosyl cobinamide kinase/adenosyl cobinamide phosphate guanylyltransferase [Dysgonomonas sp. PFB1-18]|uniref:HK97 gp10 family phage protein n=1 Tax=unclassified Dysgonomonas TaxID=2630389 RepID=UPI0024746D90|nr:MULTISPECIES: HK97 gp10 family phage protein [unclassified Dysgonomonas]MDH6308122.1 adenosyl cobinamide kinase/adenosyl cobinamide phosphate guanylyltransferase [Dysgonomonas sp. PF1-14]MDH6339661.1 adenosyl cobinamide kinase/adenosyl cobinamide phosphate guanylyltransferase [Dysgonomonas sp. PF1-16]MDH6381312.1 adenosyl cobinamide kinase/adenosyl cobinamide phosphate guanylyltransferase [Dysgonomonas sp. PFB1-18]MDH6398524.1 adenosyl cobinamide kinase/adenosyl cobinamide phosphate guanylyl
MSKYGFRAIYSRGDVHKRFAEFAQRIHKAIVSVLQYIGEACVAQARENGNYTDHTGNLRNSIGYVLVHDGTIISHNFEKRIQSKIENKANGVGVLEGKKLAEELAKRFTKGYALIVVAGMNYAYYVETLNKDVLDSAERYAQRVKPKMMKMLKEQVYRVVA